jgi:hypothetical protein
MGWDCYVDSGGCADRRFAEAAVARQTAGLAPGRPDEGVWAYVGIERGRIVRLILAAVLIEGPRRRLS